MRNFNKLLGTGCFFLCLGGWVCDGRLSLADQASPTKEAVLNAAVADAAATPKSDLTGTVVAVDHSAGSPAPVASPAPSESAATSEPAPVAPKAAEPPTSLVAPQVNVGVDGTVEQFSVQGLDINAALHILSLQSKRNIIASKEVKGEITVNLYNVTFAETLDAMLKPNGFDYIEKGNFIYVYTAKEIEDIRKRDHKTVNHIFQLHYVNSTDANTLIKPLLSSSGIVAITPVTALGLPTGTTDTGGMNYATDDILVINDFPENIADIEKALKSIDVRPKQVLVESTILNATLTDDNALGVDLVYLSGVNFPELTSVFNTSGSGSSGSSSSSTSGITPTPGAYSGKLIANGSPQTNTGTNFANAVPPGGLSIGVLNNHVSAFVRALESVTNTTIVANPKILTLNKQHGEVLVGQKLGYLTTTTSSTTTDQTVQFMDVGTKLVFRPFIGDNGYVRMEIHPEDSSGVIDVKGIPQKSTSESTSNVMIKDGRTIVIGGLFRESNTGSRGQVPILGNIPVLGIPFRQTSDSTSRSETIVLLTPHVINDDTALYDESEKSAQDVHRMVLGGRAGLQPWSRERISQLWYSKALEQMESGDKDKALMYTDWALNTNAEFIEAIKLRETLTGKKVEEASQSSINSFVRELLKADAANTPDSGSSGHYPVETPATPATK